MFHSTLGMAAKSMRSYQNGREILAAAGTACYGFYVKKQLCDKYEQQAYRLTQTGIPVFYVNMHGDSVSPAQKYRVALFYIRIKL